MLPGDNPDDAVLVGHAYFVVKVKCCCVTRINNNTTNDNTKQEAQSPLRKQGVSFMFSSHHNATLGNLALVIHYA